MTADEHTRHIQAVLSTLLFEAVDIERLRRAFAPAQFIQLHPADAAGIAEALQQVDVAVLPFDLDQRFIEAPHLRWVHCDHAGLERSARPEVLAKGLLVTGSAGRSAEALAQHVFYFALALTFRSRQLLDMQAQHQWGGVPGYEHAQSLFGKTIGIIGFGHTGRAVAALATAFGMNVIAYRRAADTSDPHVDRMLSATAGDSVDLLLAQSDVVVLAAGLNDSTYHLISTREFQRMRRGALLINIGRGGLIDHDALAVALSDGTIGGAGLDCTEPEPLPTSSPLWDMPNVVITPHMTPKLSDRTDRSIAIIEENIRRYRAGAPMLNLVTPADVFSPR